MIFVVLAMSIALLLFSPHNTSPVAASVITQALHVRNGKPTSASLGSRGNRCLLNRCTSSMGSSWVMSFPSANQVAVSTRPVASRSREIWKSSTALRVLGPKSPSISKLGDGLSLAFSVRCKYSTNSPAASISSVGRADSWRWAITSVWTITTLLDNNSTVNNTSGSDNCGWFWVRFNIFFIIRNIFDGKKESQSIFHWNYHNHH